MIERAKETESSAQADVQTLRYCKPLAAWLLAVFAFSILGEIGSDVHAYSPHPEQVPNVPSKPYHIYSDDSFLWIGTGDGRVWRSSDDGSTWSKVLDVGGVNSIVYLLEKDAQGNLYAAFENRRLYRSTNNGESWTLAYDLSNEQASARGYSTTGGFFDLKNGTIISARRSTNSPVVDRSDDWGVTWSLWRNFSLIFPDLAVVIPESSPWYLMRHTHASYFFDGKWYVTTGDVNGGTGEWQSADGVTWTRSNINSFTSVCVLEDRVFLGIDGLDPGIFMRTSDGIHKVYNPHKDIDPRMVFKAFAHDSENDIFYASLGSSLGENLTILASPDEGETWLNFINLTATEECHGILQTTIHKNYLWYVAGDRAFRLPKPTVQELLYSTYGDRSAFLVTQNFHSYTSLAKKAYKDANIQISNTSITNLATNPSLDVYSGNTPANWTLGRQGWNNTCFSNQETTDKVHGLSSHRISASKGTGYVSLLSDEFPITEGYYYLEVMAKANRSATRAVLKASVALGDGTMKSQYSPLGRNNGTWVLVTSSFYVSSAESGNARIYLVLQTSPDFILEATQVLWDRVILVKTCDPKTVSLAGFWSYTQYSCGGTIEINGREYQVTSLPVNITMSYLTGAISVKLTNARIVQITISGTEVLTATNATLREYHSNLYLARYYSNFAFTNNIENRIILAHDNLSLITSYSLTNSMLSFMVSAPSGQTSTTKIYVGEREKPKSVDGASTWSYDAASRFLTITALHSSTMSIIVRWRFLGDINNDGVVDTTDLALLSEAFGSTSGPPPDDNWNPDADLNQDNLIQILDLLLLGKNYGEATI